MLETKGFARLDKFDGGEDKWKEWMFDFKVAVKAQNEKVERAMRMIERGGELTLEQLRAADTEGEHGGEYRGID